MMIHSIYKELVYAFALLMLSGCASVSMNSPIIRRDNTSEIHQVYMNTEIQKNTLIFKDGNKSKAKDDKNVLTNYNYQYEKNLTQHWSIGLSMSPAWVLWFWEIGNFTPYIRNRGSITKKVQYQLFGGCGTGFRPFGGFNISYLKADDVALGAGLEIYKGANRNYKTREFENDSIEANNPEVSDPWGARMFEQRYYEIRLPMMLQYKNIELTLATIVPISHQNTINWSDEKMDGVYNIEEAIFKRYLEIKISIIFDKLKNKRIEIQRHKNST